METTDSVQNEQSGAVNGNENKEGHKPLRRRRIKSDESTQIPSVTPGSDDISDTAEINISEETDSNNNEDHEVVQNKWQQYSIMEKEALLDALCVLTQNEDPLSVRNDVEIIKTLFYNKFVPKPKTKRTYESEEDELDDAVSLVADPDILRFREQMNDYKEKKKEKQELIDKERVNNLNEKNNIIEEIKNLVHKEESLNKTFQEFRDLQAKWRSIGPVPQSKIRELWNNYNYHIERFYDFVKINQELRDLDLKKNLENKIALCETVEELLLDADIVGAYKKLQELHDKWKETGPVPMASRTDIWERFNETTVKINKKYQQHFIDQKEQLKKNLEEKISLCEQAEQISAAEANSIKEWEKETNKLIELQKLWKTIGFTPLKNNAAVYQRFRNACNTFFNRKKEFFGKIKDDYGNNLQLKTELCMQAEALSETTDWRKGTDEIIELQKKWKTIGPLPKKLSDKIWNRFRNACDTFFKNKAGHFVEVGEQYQKNYVIKNEMISQIESLEITENTKEVLDKLKDFQRQWMETGFVPADKKEEIQKRYRDAVNAKLDALQFDDKKKQLLKFETKVEIEQSDNRFGNKLYLQKDKLRTRMHQLESEIVLLENNMGFFAKSKNADVILQDTKSKIDKMKEEMELIKQKIKIIDRKN